MATSDLNHVLTRNAFLYYHNLVTHIIALFYMYKLPPETGHYEKVD
jgi:hypothetical protein